MSARVAVLLAVSLVPVPCSCSAAPELVEVRKIWDRAPHNAFTDLIRYHGRWWCAFREASGHVSMDGAVRILTSADGAAWESAARLESATEDLRDPKLSVTPAGELMLLAAGATHPPHGPTRQTYTWFSRDGRRWSAPAKVGDYNYWLWRVTWHAGAGYGFGYEYTKIKDLRFYRTADGRRFEREPRPLQTELFPNESSIIFLPDSRALCLLRREQGSGTALLGEARPPYREWTWKDLGRRVGGPHMLLLPDGRLLAAVRLYDGRTRTSLCWVDRESGRLDEALVLPSGGDSSYPGLVWHDGLLWVSYYSSHEGKSSIYLAKVKLPSASGDAARIWKPVSAGDGYMVELGEPAVVAAAPAGESRWGYYQFPSASRLPDGRIRVTYSMEPDAVSAHGRSGYPSLVSADEGRTWRAVPVHPLIDRCGGRIFAAGRGEFLYGYKEATFDTKRLAMPLPAGEFFSYRPVPFFRLNQCPQPLREYYATIPVLRWDAASRAWADERVRWPGAGLLANVTDGGFADKPAFESPVLEGDGELLLPEYRIGYEREDGSLPRGHEVLLMASRDGGRSFERRSAIRQRGDENLTEPTLAWNSRGELLCAFRRADHRPYLAMGLCRSKDRGRTWSAPEDVAPVGVSPQLLRMGNGALALSFGRPGVYVSFSLDGTGDKWTAPVEIIRGDVLNSAAATCGYTSLVALNPNTFLLFYSDFRYRGPGGRVKAILARPVRLQHTPVRGSARDRTIHIGSRRELLLDDFLIERLSGGARLRPHSPVAREAILVTDRPWEGSMGGYPTVVGDSGRFRLYYRGWQMDLEHRRSMARPPTICLAESADGIHWQRVPVRRFEYQGSKENNIVWMGAGDDLWGMHGFAPFLDTNPACQPERRWKAVGGGWAHPSRGLFLLTSPDGIAWKLASEKPFLAGYHLDSHNTVLWNADEGRYRIYLRQFNERKVRGILTATSPDLVHWSEAVPLVYPGEPEQALYVNNVVPYYRAPHISVGFPARYVEREWSPTIEALPELEHRRLRARMSPRYGTAVTDTVFMSSRDKVTFRRWGEAFIRPGLRSQGNWTYGDNYLAWGMLETDSALPGGGKELSFYAVEGYWRGQSTTLRRHTLRVDGFVSLHAPLDGGEMVTRPFIFNGGRLSLNISTSAAGGARVELEDEIGRPLAGYTLDDSWEIVGDTLDYTVRWKGGTDVTPLAGKTVRMRIVLSDADLYSFRFEPR